ncbi:MFS transporter [Planctomicrobium piriforme]|uniref:Major Facilitator Superfamily protein n=1 Tax=Planctomicrobium piriforme TaxID=1576369 RepID=A0A1I3CL32_9PLAN|nr:MFS transporter [Planctomicrobium piriforme]SFH74921.1 Major Facilitator Superfamily protein [Planctomicrobium piriforme]
MIYKFYLYSIFKNLRFADPFLVIYFMDLGLSYAVIGLLLGLQHLSTVLLEFPSGILADGWGRCRATSLCFVFYGLSFAGFAMTGRWPDVPVVYWLGVCLAFFALAEALRTGSHKAIMLDYLDSIDHSNRATWLIGRTRAVSKYTSATAAISGGIILSWTGHYAVLFALSAVAALCGCILLLTYPRELEGNAWRARQQPATSAEAVPYQSLRLMWRHPEFWPLFLQSVLFESQLKIVLKYFTQAFLKTGLAILGIAVIAPAGATGIERLGAFGVGLNEFVRDALGGLGARGSANFERRCLTSVTALNRIYFASLIVIVGLALCSLSLQWGLIPGVVLISLLTVLQNLRRPIFVSALNTRMEKSQRASVLSFESVCRASTIACLLPAFGWLADHYGLIAVWGFASLMLLLGGFIRLNPESARSSQALSVTVAASTVVEHSA